jgi:hypothetical protein
VNGEGYFTIERFKGRRSGNFQAFVTALKKRNFPALKVESGTAYKHFLTHGEVIIMISSIHGLDANAKLFSEVQQNLLSSVKTEN